MNILTLDVESTIFKYDGEIRATDKRGSPFSTRNFCVMVGHKWLNKEPFCITPEAGSLKSLYTEIIDNSDMLVGFNIKFDLHWLANIGVNIHKIKRVWDCQIAEFLLSAQRTPYNSLNDACDKYNIPRKLDVVKTEYWDKGKDTDAIPVDVLSEYLEGDLDRTERVFKIQYEIFTGEKL